MFSKTRQFADEVQGELRKASWPWDPKEKGFKKYKELSDSTIVVVVAMFLLVHVLSGQENKVLESLKRRIKTEEMGDVVYEVLIPTERVSEIKRGKKTETTRKFFPGYLIINVHLIDENKKLVDRAWYFIRDTPGVIGFAGPKDRPVPMRDSEVESLLAQMREREDKIKPKVSFEVGETVKVADVLSRIRAAWSKRSTRPVANCVFP